MTDTALPSRSSPNVSRWMRQLHRWISVAFVVSVVATTIALSQPEPMIWVSYVPLAPLFLLFLTGTYLLPCLIWRVGVRAAESDLP